ncbi:hypothetical protein E3U55_12445 [Filobacillus milosensis]|uniref:Uncharacterized protein n=1 Tax=Filobacillus milosensis TaxID=94137 RepID=A0A4Y8III8_9BACI|nr:hypothetical protein [Filobacillus milosensis]TFB15055.1 hypothetical protein E3U55_12445 [Filobacillus milosensis]
MSNEENDRRIEEVLANAKKVKVVRPKQNFGPVWKPNNNNDTKRRNTEEQVAPQLEQKRPPFFWI